PARSETSTLPLHDALPIYGTHEHPTQALLDAYTMSQRLGDLAGRRVVIVGDLTHSRVFRSNVLLLGALGAEVTVVAPPTLMPSGDRKSTRLNSSHVKISYA